MENSELPDSPRLVADVGGTNARFSLETSQGVFEHTKVLPCADYPTIDAALRTYLAEVKALHVKQGGIAIATPVEGDDVNMTNHHWGFSIEDVRRKIGFETLLVVNDFTALAMSLPHLKDTQLKQIGGGMRRPHSVMGLIGPGTGLGVSGMVPFGTDGWTPLASEGGHVSFSPSNRREGDILNFVWQERNHVSAERLVSGPGLVLIYRALCSLNNVTADPIDPIEIARRARAKTCPVCTEVFSIFCSMLGNVASNLALTLGSFGGIYIGGGIIRKLGDLFDYDAFRRHFETKGRFSRYLSRIPTYLIIEDYPAFLGVSALLNR
ncbi:MAG: glucokinase [Pseudomonadota bacterium]